MDTNFIAEYNQDIRNLLCKGDLEQLRDRILLIHGHFQTEYSISDFDDVPIEWDNYIFLHRDLFEDNVSRFGDWRELERNEVARQNFKNHINSLIYNIPNFSDLEIIMGIRASIAQLLDAHSGIFIQEFYSIILPFDVKVFTMDFI